ncbi:peroxisomal membrane protein 13 isoform X1 [Cryptomeria japonica]|uniref:peroxisomal membrane protein 13 isoform X1 n=2 Tax=Cryptomeria japonica TaxID=3369 RepID=UPI0027DA85F6|nr:peroxisomal membrane protein 13 isoform X1 [Cryptomeria japonica]
MAGNMPPRKPWENVESSSGPSPFRPSSTGPTSTVVESAGVANIGEKNLDAERRLPVANRSTIGRPMPQRPWEQNRGVGYGSNYAGFGSMTNNNSSYGAMTPYNSGYGSGMYGSNSMYGGLGGYGSTMGGSYSGGLYGNNMYRGYGSPNGYGGMLNNGMGGPMGGYGFGSGGPYDNGIQDPNNPFGGPPSPPSFWQSMLRALHGVVNIFGRIANLIDENTQAFHFFITALLQLFDRSGLLYGEIARFVLRLLGIRTKSSAMPRPGSRAIAGQETPENYYIEEPKGATGAFENVWEDEGGRPQ